MSDTVAIQHLSKIKAYGASCFIDNNNIFTYLFDGLAKLTAAFRIVTIDTMLLIEHDIIFCFGQVNPDNDMAGIVFLIYHRNGFEF